MIRLSRPSLKRAKAGAVVGRDFGRAIDWTGTRLTGYMIRRNGRVKSTLSQARCSITQSRRNDSGARGCVAKPQLIHDAKETSFEKDWVRAIRGCARVVKWV